MVLHGPAIGPTFTNAIMQVLSCGQRKTRYTLVTAIAKVADKVDSFTMSTLGIALMQGGIRLLSTNTALPKIRKVLSHATITFRFIDTCLSAILSGITGVPETLNRLASSERS